MDPLFVLRIINLRARLLRLDDLLDYLRHAPYALESHPTDEHFLPLLYTLHNGNEVQRALIQSVIENGGKDRIDEVIAAIESTGAIAYTSRSAQIEADKAIAQLAIIPDSPYKEALVALAQYAVSRSH